MIPVDPVPVDPETDITPAELADASQWLKRIKNARKFDEDARLQMAYDRRDARGDTKAEVSSNIIGTFIDISGSFLVAKNPACDVLPAKSTEPPSMDAITEAALASIPPEVQQQAMLAGQLAGSMPIPTGDPNMPAARVDPAMAQQAVIDQYVEQRAQEIQKRFQKRQRDNKAFAETLELVIERMWVDADLKAAAKRWVLSALTVGSGWMKASWQERTAPDPEVLRQVNDLQDNIKRAAALRVEIAEDGAGDEADAKTAEYERQLLTLEGQVERVVARGFVIDFVPSDQVQVAPGFELSRYFDAPWIAHQIPMLREDAKVDFGLTDDRIKPATMYKSRKPDMGRDVDSPHVIRDLSAQDADQYTTGFVTGTNRTDAMGPNGEEGDYVMVWEIWDRTSNSVLTGIEGVRGWVKKAWSPCATTRFYPFFLFTISDVDGQRWPQSLTSRSKRLIAEYNRIGSAEAEHRRRILPKSIFDATNLTPEDAKKITDGTTAEMIGVSPRMPDTDVRKMVVNVQYPPIDPMLYDRSRIVNELERIWGVQEALTGSVTVDKTATEAEIQQGGFQARMGGRRDAMEDAFSKLALYTAEIARCYMTIDDVTAICGPDAMWPEYHGAESLREMVNVEIRAGSSGKPNTSAERNSWATLLPILTTMQAEVAMLRMSTNADLADAKVKLAQMTAEKSGERMDVDSIFPPPGPQQLSPEGAPQGSTDAA